MKKLFRLCVLSLLTFSFFGAAYAKDAAFNPKGSVTVVSREDGSGTRGAFIELLGIEVRGADGSRRDMTTKEAVIANKTDVMLTAVAGDPHAIGYVSMGSLNGRVKALSIEGAAATTANVKSGAYPIARPFIVATKKDGAISAAAKDFMTFLLSREGQEVVTNGYIAIDESAPAFFGARPSGKVTVAGSSSVTPIMEKLKEAYAKRNPNAEIEIQMSDSTAGMTAAINGVCEIGMASRELKASEAEHLSGVPIALDGIAVVVNTANPVSDMSREGVRGIFTGKVPTWDKADA
jgi:phosphate transport system substrate-binding protein